MPKGKQRRIVKKIIASAIVELLDGLIIDEAIEHLDDYKDDSFDVVKLRAYYDYDYTALQVVGERKENDKEYEKRCKLDERHKKDKIKRAKAQLLKAQKELKKLEA